MHYRKDVVDHDGAPRDQEDGYELPASFWQAMATLDARTGPVVTAVIRLYQEFPAWAVWLPRGGGPWVAARPAPAGIPVVGLPSVRVHAGIATELADRMRGMDWQLN
jgi:hypothetical protein